MYIFYYFTFVLFVLKAIHIIIIIVIRKRQTEVDCHASYHSYLVGYILGCVDWFSKDVVSIERVTVCPTYTYRYIF